VARRFTRSEEGLEDGRQDQSGRGDPSPEEEVRLKEALRELELAEDPSFQ